MEQNLQGLPLDRMVEALVDKKFPLITNLSNAAAVLKELKNINWCGFYLFDGDHTLYLGPFQGDPACTLIPLNRGVCGHAATLKQTVIVANVNEFPGHIACSSASKSEIVTPILKEGELKAVIDIDAPVFDRFTEQDKILLEKIATILSEVF